MNEKYSHPDVLKQIISAMCRVPGLWLESNNTEEAEGIDRLSRIPEYVGLWWEVPNTGSSSMPPVVVRTQEYLALYGYETEAEFPSNPLRLVKREHRRRLADSLQLARSGPKSNIVDCTFQIRTKNGEWRWVNAFAQRLDVNVIEEDGTSREIEVLASLHIDVTTAQRARSEFGRMQKFYEGVLDAVPGFVFLKEVLATKSIVFRYANKELTARLLQKPANAITEADRQSVLNKSDRHFISDVSQIERFEEADRKVHETGRPEFLPEETFGKDGAQIRLATIKVPFSTSRWTEDGSERRYVLGIAVDITHITELLRLVMNESQDGIYIKSTDGKYLLVNPAFRKLLGLSESLDIEGKTFSDLVRAKSEYPEHKVQIDKLIKQVEREDLEMPERERLEHLRHAIFSDRRVLLTRKQFIKHPTSESGVILGLDQDSFHAARVDRAIVSRMTQCACIKNDRFEIVWCNEAYAKQHGGDGPEEFIGKTDYDLWPDKQFPGQAAKYRSDDRRALKLAASLYHFRRVGDADGALESESQLNSLRSFQGPQVARGGARGIRCGLGQSAPCFARVAPLIREQVTVDNFPRVATHAAFLK